MKISRLISIRFLFIISIISLLLLFSVFSFALPSSALPVSLYDKPYAVWVADNQQGIVKIDHEGNLLGENPDIIRPNDIAIDTHGRIWVASIDEKVLTQLDPDTLKTKAEFRDFGIITDILADPLTDNLVVLDTGRNKVVTITPEGAVVFETKVSFPISMAYDLSDGSIWVGGRETVFKVAQNGDILLKLEGLVNRPESMAADPVTGEVWIADTGHAQVLRLSSEGKVLSQTYVRNPIDIALNLIYGGVVVLDRHNKKIHFIDEKGNIFKTMSKYLDEPKALDVDPVTGHLWVLTDTRNVATLKHFSADGNVLLKNTGSFFVPLDLAFDYSEKATVRETYLSEIREMAYPRIPSRLSAPRYGTISVTEEHSGGDKGLLRGSLREYMKSDVHLSIFKAFDYRAAEYRPKPVRSDSIYDVMAEYCRTFLENARYPFMATPYTESVRSNVILNECNIRAPLVSYYAGIAPAEQGINLLSLSPIPTVEEIDKETTAPARQ